ncbi:hypothetical protein SAMN06265795_12231 [Noviherbaspirillum humi]|uniref:Phage protein, HK97 gp10 family n=1 Tax=Noviherbaspirillum humi TaxID=1688639 RepID=A0A239LDV7_9BURK|nr:hypothetical protein [Noviherbaspirillum humi]SNT28817.1 hypothetical protein SAMN06265795_12231 [Noviherbaspirillum humi]
MLFASVKHNIAEVVKGLNDVAKTQLPFAIAKGLTDTAKEVRIKMTDALPNQFDKPTPFTMRAFGYTPATKARQIATVFVRHEQLKYLQFQIDGGVRSPARRALLIPKGVRLNQYGNMTRGAIKKLLSRPDVFSGKVDGVPGIYQRKGGKVILLVAYADQVKYRRRYPFAEIGQRAVSKAFDGHFSAAIAKAVATMR